MADVRRVVHSHQGTLFVRATELLKILLSKRRGLLALLPFEERKKFEMAEIKLCARVRVCSNSASATFYNKLGKLRPPLSLSLSPDGRTGNRLWHAFEMNSLFRPPPVATFSTNRANQVNFT